MKTLAQLLPALPGARVVGELAGVSVGRVHSDTRTLQPGDLFVALRGERFDANDYLPLARACGAVAALAECGAAVARTVRAALDCRDRQQRQDHGDTDDRVHPARGRR